MTTRRPVSTKGYSASSLPGPMTGRLLAMEELTRQALCRLVGMGRRGGICRKGMSPIKLSYFFEMEEVLKFIKLH